MDTSKPKKPMPKGIPALKPKAKKAMPMIMDEEDYGPTPPDIADKLQDIQNRKGAEQYEATKTYKKGGSVSSASKRADGCCVKGKTRGKML
jgi:hypothetical protein